MLLKLVLLCYIIIYDLMWGLNFIKYYWEYIKFDVKVLSRLRMSSKFNNLWYIPEKAYFKILPVTWILACITIIVYLEKFIEHIFNEIYSIFGDKFRFIDCSIIWQFPCFLPNHRKLHRLCLIWEILSTSSFMAVRRHLNRILEVFDACV